MSRASVGNAAGVSVRAASGADLKAVASVMVRAFCKEDEMVRGIQESILGKLGVGEVAEELYQRICYWEVADQLGKRLIRPEMGGKEMKEAFAKRHVVLVAVDNEGRLEAVVCLLELLFSCRVLEVCDSWH